MSAGSFSLFQCRKRTFTFRICNRQGQIYTKNNSHIWKVLIKQFLLNMTTVLAQYSSSNQDQEININEKRSALLLKKSRYLSRLHLLRQLTGSLFYITDSLSVQNQQKNKIRLQYAVHCFSS